MTQEQLADRLGVSLRFVQRLEAGQKNSTVRALAEVAAVFRIDVSTLFAPPKTRLIRMGRPRKV